jgi:23S rRNA (adenine-N6)-dimethyltransferase
LQKEAARKFSGSPKESLFSILAKPFFEFQIVYQLRRTDFWPMPAVDSVLLSIKRRTRPLIEMHEIASYRDFVQYGFGRWKPNLKSAFKSVFTYKQWKRLARDVQFPLNATPTELSFEQWLDLYRGFVKSTRQQADWLLKE